MGLYYRQWQATGCMRRCHSLRFPTCSRCQAQLQIMISPQLLYVSIP